MSLLNKLTVDGFKSIESCELELQRLNVVIGPNGAGKSNLIGVFRFLNSVLSKQLQLYVGEQRRPTLLHHGEKTTPKMSFRFDFGSNAYSFCLKPAVGDTMVFDMGDDLLPRCAPLLAPMESSDRRRAQRNRAA